MKNYRIKTGDFSKLTSNKNLLTSEQKTALEKYQNKLGIKPVKFLPKGKDIILIIDDESKYYVTCKPVYIDSVVKILESVSIDSDSIVLMNRQANQSNELSVEQLKNILSIE